MMRRTSVLGVVFWIGVVSASWAQSDITLRTRMVLPHTQQIVDAYCGVEFSSTSSSRKYVCFGAEGLTVYRYVSNAVPERVGHLTLKGSTVVDIDVDSPTVSGEAFLVLTDSTNQLYILRLSVGANDVLTPYGRASVGASRSQIERLIGGSYLIVVGTTTGRVRAYVWSPSTPTSLPQDTLNLGTPLMDLPLFADAVRALRAWTAGGTTYVAVGGSDGVVYLLRWDGTGLVQVGKAMYHPSQVAEIVVSGSRLAVGCTNGQVYVWNYTSTTVTHHLTLKEGWAPLSSHSLCALPNDQLAVATAFVRVYRLSDGVQSGEFGGVLWGNYLREYYYETTLPNCTWHPSFYRLHSVRVLPSISSGSYFVMTAPSMDVGYRWYPIPRTVFVRSEGFTHQVTPGSHPVYALANVSNGIASGRSDGSVTAPWGTRNVGAPVFALAGFTVQSTHWLIGSYGVGRMFAWSSGGTFIPDIMPASSLPRIIYDVQILSVSTTEVLFAVAAGDGKVELCRWTLSSTPATVLSSRSVSLPLHCLSVNANRTQVAVSSLLSAASEPTSWRIEVSGNTLGVPQSVGRYSFVSYHPTNPDLLALGAVGGTLALSSSSTTRFIHIGRLPGYWNYDSAILGDPLRPVWISADYIAAAYIWNGYVGVWWTEADTVTHSVSPTSATNPYRGGYDRAFQEVYEPHRDRVFALIATPSGELVSGGADRRVVRWSRAGRPVYATWSLSPLVSLDFSPMTGHSVYPARSMFTDTRHALLWWNLNADFYWTSGGGVVLALRATDSNVKARALSPWIAHDVLDNDVVIKYMYRLASFPNYNTSRYRIEASEDGSWVLVTATAYRQQIGSGQFEIRAPLLLLPSMRYFSGAQSSDFYTVVFPDGSGGRADSLSPSGTRLAVSFTGREVRVYDRSGSGWNLSTPTTTIPIALPPNAHMRFLADDVLAIAYVQSNTLRLDVYQLSGNSWVLRQQVDTGLRRTPPIEMYRYFIDAIEVGSYVRIAVACDEGLVFYRMSRIGGSVSLTEVGRSTWSVNDYWDVAYHSWVRFSRFNPNYLSVANGTQTVVYDLTNLFSW